MTNIELNSSDRFAHSSTSKGNQQKWFKNNIFYKADSMGYEGLAELFSSKICENIDDFNYVPYFLCEITEGAKTYNGCHCTSFLNEAESVISFAHILEKKYTSFSKYLKNGCKESVRFVTEEIFEATGLDVFKYIADNLLLDAITLNEDRHLNNLAVIKGNSYYRIAPVFDNGLAFLSDIGDYTINEDLNECIKRVKAKPFLTRFQRQAEVLLEMGAKPLKFKKDFVLKSLKDTDYGNYDRQYAKRCMAVARRNIIRLEGLAWKNP